jgi:hypothetical protein
MACIALSANHLVYFYRRRHTYLWLHTIRVLSGKDSLRMVLDSTRCERTIHTSNVLPRRSTKITALSNKSLCGSCIALPANPKSASTSSSPCHINLLLCTTECFKLELTYLRLTMQPGLDDFVYSSDKVGPSRCVLTVYS